MNRILCLLAVTLLILLAHAQSPGTILLNADGHTIQIGTGVAQSILTTNWTTLNSVVDSDGVQHSFELGIRYTNTFAVVTTVSGLTGIASLTNRASSLRFLRWTVGTNVNVITITNTP